MIRVRGERVTLRPLTGAEFDLLWEYRRSEGAPPSQRALLRRRFAHSGEFHDGFLDLAIEAGGRLVGEIDARQPKRAMPRGVYEVGIALFDTGDRGRGYGTEAVALLADYLFREAGAHRVQGSTSVDNAAMRRAFERAGFTFEGVMRSFMVTGVGEPEDYALYAVIRSDRG